MENIKIKKVCNFSASSVHFSVMILPYLKKELEPEKNVITFFERDLEKNIEEILLKINVNNEIKQKILNINWKESIMDEKSIMENIENNLKTNDNLDIIVYGSEDYIDSVNKIIDSMEIKSDKNKCIKVINSYNINEIKKNMKKILNQYSKIINTSGEQNISSFFDVSFTA